MSDGPLLTRRRLGVMLRDLRLASGKTVDDIEYADLMGKSKLYNIEGGRQPKPSWPEIQELAKFLGASPDLVNELVRMAKACLNTGWYVPFDVPQQFQSYLDLEGSASKLSFYESEFINGLFQVETYTAALQRYWDSEPNTVEQRLAMHTQRGQRFWGRTPIPEVALLMSESALRRLDGVPGIRQPQLDRLTELAAKPNVSVHVVPFSAGIHASMHGAYTLMEFDASVYPEVAYVESSSECRYHERSAVVSRYRRIFTETLDNAVPLEELLT